MFMSVYMTLLTFHPKHMGKKKRVVKKKNLKMSSLNRLLHSQNSRQSLFLAAKRKLC